MIHAFLCLGSLVATAADAEAPPRVTAIEGVAITVDDLDRSIAFYRDVLEFEVEGVEERTGDSLARLEGVAGASVRVAKLRIGEERIELRDFVTPDGRPFPADSQGNDGWFQHVAIVVADMARAHSTLAAEGVEPASIAPQRLPDWNPDAGGIEAYYFRDPDRHYLELIRFPAGKGDPRWHAPSDRLFLGIDHTAIVVADTERALEFYRDRLGLRVTGGSENHGVEQERLNAVFGARLRITTLRAPRGMGVELLDYLSPGDGRDIARDVRANDLQHWWTLAEVADLAAVASATRSRHPSWVSPGPIAPAAPGERPAFTLRDPDRHGWWLTSR